MKKLILNTLLITLCSINVIAQTTLLNDATSGTTVTGCSGTFELDLDCKVTGTDQYCDDEDWIITFCPTNSGEAVGITFNSFDVDGTDQLCIFDGPDISATSLGCNNNLTTLNGIQIGRAHV